MADVVVVEREGIGLATVIARKGRREALSITLRGMGIEIPEGPRRASDGDLALIGIGPGTWLATHERGPDALKTAIAPLDAAAAIADQSGAYAVLRLTGTRVRDTLAKLIFIDLHPRAFPIGAAASTVAAHIAVILWRLEDGPEGAVFEIALYRSFAASFWHALSQSTCDKNARVRSSFG
jgi:sarcosine oxidase subunit gamma